MNFRTIALISSLVSAGGVFGCAHQGPSQDLLEAQLAYHRAESSKAASEAPDELHTAATALKRAEAANRADPQSPLERHFAYLATRRVETAVAIGETRAAEKAAAQTEEDYRQVQDDLRRIASGKLAERNKQLQATKQESESRARDDAETRAEKALQGLAEAKREAQRTVITLSGEVLFRTGEAQLLDLAKNKLDEVARALKAQSTNTLITVVGHTDSLGSDQRNIDLSLARARAVRSYLVDQGVDSSRIQALGKGERQPSAANDTAEGRANNRRVEVIIEPQPVG